MAGGAGFVPSVAIPQQQQQPPQAPAKGIGAYTMLGCIAVPKKFSEIPAVIVVMPKAAVAVALASLGSVSEPIVVSPTSATATSSASLGSVVITGATTGRETKVPVFSNPWGVW